MGVVSDVVVRTFFLTDVKFLGYLNLRPSHSRLGLGQISWNEYKIG